MAWYGALVTIQASIHSALPCVALASAAILPFIGLIWFSAKRMLAAEHALREHVQLWRTIVDRMPQMAWLADAAGNYSWFNERWYAYNGSTFEDSQGANWMSLYHPDQASEVRDKWNVGHNNSSPWEAVYQLRSRSGEYRWFLSRALPVFDEAGKVARWFGTETDIDKQVRAETALRESQVRAENANQAKTQFLANMSHEIRTPIGVITGFAELLKASNLTHADRLRYTQIIEQNSTQLLRLIDDILDLSRVEAGKINLEHKEFSLTDLLATFTSAMALKAAERGIGYSTKLGGPIPSLICTDQLRLRQILNNVVGNALKFTERGFVRLTVEYTAPTLTFTVSDTGMGIAPEQVGRLFHAFSQADPSTTRRFGGTGLGLVLSRCLSQALGGDLVLVESRLGQGSTFAAMIGAPPVEGAALIADLDHLPVSEASALELGEYRLHGLRVLLVEDSLDNVTLIMAYLDKTGVRLQTADNGIDGYRQAIAHAPDVVLMDVQMPGMDGRESTRRLRRAGFDKPIIALTAHAMREERDRCFEAGCTDYLTKPLQRNALLDVLSQYVPSVTA